MYIQLDKSDRETKKYKAIFYDNQRKKIITTHFGQRGANDYTLTHDDEAKQRYIERHKNNEDWSNFFSAGSLSYHLLWTEKSMAKAYNNYIKKFNLKKY
jgi:Family of unknown function (DUF5754)